jgi:predicted NUDIX family NTP pyrophosphohydrolase
MNRADMNDEVTTSLRRAVMRLHPRAAELDAAAAKRVTDEAVRRFVLGSPRAWWMNLAVPAEVTDSTASTFIDVVPEKTGRCWLIPEIETAGWPVFDVEVADIQAILNDCPFFEYYVVARDFSWLLAESDHDEFFVCRAG